MQARQVILDLSLLPLLRDPEHWRLDALTLTEATLGGKTVDTRIETLTLRGLSPDQDAPLSARALNPGQSQRQGNTAEF